LATYGWRQGRGVDRGLFEEGHRFGFLEAVHLLEFLLPERTPPGEGTEPGREVARFRSRVRLDFPASDVEEVSPLAAGRPAEMTVNILGLAGVLGPLPPHVTELVIERAFHKDGALRDFLDLFNHRLIAIFYRARKKYRPALDPGAPDRGRVARVLYALLGLGTPHLAGRLGLPDRSLLAYAGLLADPARSTVGLVRMLEDCFSVAVEVVPFQGRWCALEEEDMTRIGAGGRNHALGGGAVLGRRIWDQAASFELRLGPMPLARFLTFLPGGAAHRAVLAAVRFYVREELGFTLRPILAAAQVPESRIGRAGGPRLGWTSWLKTRQPTRDDSQVRLAGRA
jgi:type VI secretion system protein ImpH